MCAIGRGASSASSLAMTVGHLRYDPAISRPVRFQYSAPNVFISFCTWLMMSALSLSPTAYLKNASRAACQDAGCCHCLHQSSSAFPGSISRQLMSTILGTREIPRLWEALILAHPPWEHETVNAFSTSIAS